MMRPEGTRPYRAYLLRCWCEEGKAADGSASWRFSVEEILEERRRSGFDSLEDMVSFLRAELIIGDPDHPCESDPSP